MNEFFWMFIAGLVMIAFTIAFEDKEPFKKKLLTFMAVGGVGLAIYGTVMSVSSLLA